MSFFRGLRAWIPVFLILALGASLPALSAPPRSLVRKEMRFADSPGAAEFPEAQALYLVDDIGFEVEPDGHTVYTEHDAIKALTAEGAASLSVLTRTYRADAESIQLEQARTISPEGDVLDVPTSNIRDLPLAPESPLYSQQRLLRVEFPEVRPGSVVEFRLKTRRVPCPDGRWWGATFVQNLEPILHSTFTVRIPQDTEIHWNAPGVTPGRPSESARKGQRVLRWEVRDVPGLTPEPAMPATARWLNRIEVTNLASWPELGDWFGRRWKSAVEDTQGLDIVTAGIVPTTRPAEDRIRAVLAWAAGLHKVQENLADPWNPGPASQALRASTLSPTDMAVLLSATLDRLGLPSEPVMASTLQEEHLERELPQPGKVDRILLRLRSPRGGWWWIDPASPGELLDAPPGGAQGVAAILVRSEGSRIFTTPISSADRNLRDVQMEVRVEQDGRAELTMSMTTEGTNAALWRSLERELAKTPNTERERLLDRLFHSLVRSFAVSGRLYSRYFPEDPEPGAPFRISTTLVFSELATSRDGGRTRALPLPLYGGDRLVSLAESTTRRFPAHFDFPFRDDVRIHVALPEGCRILELPPNLSLQNSLGSFFSTTRQKENHVWMYSRLVLNRTWVMPKDFAELRRLAQAQATLLTNPMIYESPTSTTQEDP
ncbi:MAG: DUF3857 domain-containing protein [Burkholderiales bacterium]|nr:DUF3857 domain-containing protein [Burkholderiales bacterium]